MHAETVIAKGQPVPRVTLYVKDSDAPIWEKARALALDKEDSLSSMASEGLAIVVERREAELRREKADAESMETIELSGVDLDNDEKTRKLRFVGKLVVEEGMDAYYVTRSKKVVLEHHRPTEENQLAVFDSFDEFMARFEGHGGWAPDASTIIAIAEALGEEYFEELD